MCMYRPNNDRLIVDEEINGIIIIFYTYIAKKTQIKIKLKLLEINFKTF